MITGQAFELFWARVHEEFEDELEETLPKTVGVWQRVRITVTVSTWTLIWRAINS